MELDRADILRFKAGLLGDAACGTADVERAHGELRSRFTDRLRCDDADGFADLDQFSGREISAVAADAGAAPGLAGQYRANFHALDTGRLNRAGEVFRDLLIDLDDDFAFVVFDLLERHTADDTISQRLDDFARLDDGSDVDAVHCSAVAFADDHVLRDVHQTASEISGVRGLESRIRQTLACAVRRDEVLLHGKTFAEVCRDRRFDNFTRRLRHQTAHPGQLANLLFRSARAGIRHQQDGIESVAGFLRAFHFGEHHVGDLFGHVRPDRR